MLLERDRTRPPMFERIHSFADAPVPLKNGSKTSARELAHRIYESELAVGMLDQPFRYSVRYGYDREDMRNDNGHDVCPIGHQMELAYHTGKVLEAEIDEGSIYGSLPDEEIGILMLTCMIHDIGESTHPVLEAAGLKPVGDIPSGLKSDENRTHEAAIRKFMYEMFFADVDTQVIERIEAIISHRDDSVLHELFEAGHLAQTIETSNFAHYSLARERWYREGEVIDISTADGSQLSGLLGIARVVYACVQNDISKYSHFSYIRTAAAQAKELRYPKHTILN